MKRPNLKQMLQMLGVGLSVGARICRKINATISKNVVVRLCNSNRHGIGIV